MGEMTDILCMKRLRSILCLLGALACSVISEAAEYQVKPGDTLAKIAIGFYGSRTYGVTLAKYNRIAFDKPMDAGAIVRAPDLKTMVMKEGLSEQVEAEVDLILTARYEFMKIENELRGALARAPANGRAVIPVGLRKVLRNAAKDLEEAGRTMARKAVYAESAVRVRQRLEGAARDLRALAEGKNNEGLADAIHRQIAQAWVRLLMWARLEDG